ncbi:MAG TPA: Lrp/AsnC family transcriptional regulator [Chitinispirillaceae bacterium]|nr:Lrp/AsnC family transcriptional regulator [Chitinispirillaceae bacterium]
MAEMTKIERALLNLVQTQFPLNARPFRIIAEKAGITEDDCLFHLRRLADRGILRTIRAVINWRKVGFSTTLAGVCVKPEHLDRVASEINQYEQVTHNYMRDGERNLWFTIIYESEEQKKGVFKKIINLDGVEDLKEFPAEKTYKIGLVLDV